MVRKTEAASENWQQQLATDSTVLHTQNRERDGLKNGRINYTDRQTEYIC